MKTKSLMLVATLLIGGRLEAGNCFFQVDPTNIVFGTYSVFGAGSLTGTSPYTFRCSPNTEAVLTFTTGANSSNYSARYMANGGRLLQYNLYDDAANSVILGDGTGGTMKIDLAAEPRAKTVAGTIHASTALGLDVPPGIYTDTVTALLTWDGGANSSSVTFTVTADVQPECQVTATPVAFGNYDPIGTHSASPLDAEGGVTVFCTETTVGEIALSDGLNFAAGTRRMAGSAGGFLDYDLYRNAARNLIWRASPNTVSAASTSKLVPIGGGMIVYGRVPAGQDPLVGAYNDTVQATVNY